MNLRYCNPTPEHEADAAEIFAQLSAHLRAQKGAIFVPHLDVLLPELQPELVAEIAIMLERLDEEAAVMKAKAPASSLFASTHRIVTEDGKVHFVSLEGDRGCTKEDWARDREPSFRHLGGRWLYQGERQDPLHGFKVTPTEDAPHRAYRYLDQTFTIEANLEPGNLILYHALGEDRPLLITRAERRGDMISLSSLAEGRAGGMYEVDGYELTADGWQKHRVPVRASVEFERRMLGNYVGFQSWKQVYSDAAPVDILAARQRDLMGRRDREAAERREAEAEDKRRLASEGLWLGEEIEKTIGNVPDSVMASALRTWFKRHGVDATVKVRRYSMASGLSFNLNDRSEAGEAALARISDISPRSIGILSSNRTGQQYVLIRYPYADELATLLAQRTRAYVQKRPEERHYSLSEDGQRIADGASIAALFGAAHMAAQPSTVRSDDESPATETAGAAVVTGRYTVARQDYRTSPGSKKKPREQRTIPDLWSVRFHERLPKEQFKETARLAEANDGWFARHNGAFWFREKKDVDAFVEALP